MASVNPSVEQFEQFARTAPDDRPIVMVNLLRFCDVAAYGPDARKPVSGRKAYSRYSRAVLPLLWEVGGNVLWLGRVRASLIAPAGENWDEVALVYYPSRAAFARMVRSEAYREAMKHRTAALADSRLIETRVERVPRWVFRAASALIRARARVFPKIRG